jgi:hypothetical protein
MATRTTATDFGSNQLEKADAKMKQLFHEMIGHGFFKFEVSGSVIQGGKRVVVVTAGRDFKFTIPKEDIPQRFLKKDGS